MEGYKATERRLRQKRDQKIASYLTYATVAAIILIICVVGFIVSSSYLKPGVPQSPDEREYTLMKEELKKDPNNVEFMMRLAQAGINLGKTSESINVMKKAVKIQKYAPMLHFTLGQAYWAGGNTKEAIKAYEQELKITQDANELAAYDLGRIYYEKKQYDKALGYFQMAMQRMSTAADLHYYLGLTYEAKKDNKAAIAEYKEVLQFIPDHREAADAIMRLTGESVDPNAPGGAHGSSTATGQAEPAAPGESPATQPTQ